MEKPVILCVDDEKMVLRGLKEQLKGRLSNYNIEIAESGMEALELIEELVDNNIELPVIISDYAMPGMKGDELLEKIHKTLPDTVKIMLTGQATIDGVKNAVNCANLYRYIAKPWEHEDLYLTISEALKSFYSQKQLVEQNKKLESLNKELVEMNDAVVGTIMAAIDRRDVTTAGHSKRVAEYAVKLAEAISRVDYGVYKDLHFTPEQIQELNVAALLHDIGKIGIKERILQKRYRLNKEHQNILTYKFNYLKKCLRLKEMSREISEDELVILGKIDEYLSFILQMCKREYITSEEEEKVIKISQIEYVDIDNEVKFLLDDFEVDNLTVKRGNLTEKERKIVNTHVDHTYAILKKIPWSKNFKLVPEIASCHHERINGTGYRGLTGEQILVQSKILALIDIFEALTALDRPYKSPMPIEKALSIINEEVEKGNIDRDIFNVFVRENIHDIYKEVNKLL